MNKTKQKILDTALILFNKHGLSNITLRKIANEIGISQGNLNYHFKKREDIIEALYYELVHKIDTHINSLSPFDISINTLVNIGNTTLFCFYEYRFFLLDFTQIMRTQNKIREHYTQLLKFRKTQTLELLNILILKKLIRKEQFDNEYENLCIRIQILGDFWMSSASIKDDAINIDLTTKYCQIIKEILYPYLTPTGILEYKSIVETDSKSLKF